MPTQDTLIPIILAQGVNTKTDPKAVRGNLLVLENGVFTKGSTIQKRYGTTAFATSIVNSGSAVLTTGSALSVFNNELLVFDGNHMYSRSETNNNLLDRGTCVSVQVKNNPVFVSNIDITRTTSAVNQGIGCYAWFDGTNIIANVVDKQVGAAIATGINVTAAYAPTGQFQMFASGNSIFIVFASGGGLICARLNLINPTYFSGFATLCSDLNSLSLFDITEFRGGAVLAYLNSAPAISLIYVSSIGIANNAALGQSAITIAETAIGCVSVISDPLGTQNISVVWYNTSAGTRAQSFDNSLNKIGGIVTMDSNIVSSSVNATGYISGVSASIFFEKQSSLNVNERVKSAVINISGSVVLSGSDFVRSVGLAGKAFLYNGKGFVPTVFNSPLQATYFLHSSDRQQVAKMQNQIAGGYSITGSLSKMNFTTVSGIPTYSFSNLFKAVVTTTGSDLYANRGVTETSIGFSTNNEFSAIQLGKNLHVVGGYLQNYDGTSLTEHGFNVYPEGQTLSGTVTTSGGSIGSGSVQVAGAPSVWTYYFTYRYRDTQGQLHESTPSVGQNVTMTGSANQVSWSIPTLRLTNKLSASIGVYRSTINNVNAVFMISNLTGVLNTPGVDSVTFVDTNADVTLPTINGKVLYTIGGVLSNDCPPAPAAVTTNKNRLWTISSENPLQLFYSQIFAQDNGVAFNLLDYIQVDPQGGPCTVLSSMDNQLIIFKQSRIYYLAGDGPDGTGQNSDYGDPVQLSTDVGCINPTSVVLTNLGLFFQSSKGIYLLNRGLQIQYIGANVEKYNSYEITSAVVLPDANQVRFTLLGGPTLVYDTFVNEWSPFIGAYQNINGSTLYTNSHVIVSPGGNISIEDKSTYQDNFRNSSMTMETAWIKFTGVLQGFQRVKKVHLLGSLGSRHNLFVEVFFDYNDAAIESFTFNTANALNGTTWGSDGTWGSGTLWGSNNQTYNGPSNSVYQWQHSMQNQKCEAIKFRITDTYSGSLGAGYSVNELLITGGAKKGAFKLPGNKVV